MKIIAFLLLALLNITPATQTANTDTRTITGSYVNYMVIETVEGDYLIDDPQDYLVYDSTYMDYVPVFEEGEQVQVTLDTKGTETKEDDTILSVSSTQRKEVATVTDTSGDLITAVTNTGNEYCYYGGGVTVGQQITLVFDNNGTEENLEDDTIIDVL